VQAAGRGVRHAEDWCITMITDANFGQFYRRATFPKWFEDAIRRQQTFK
jgi:Rad3-related DNA helicase